MDWIKIPTDCILHPEYKDSELILLIRYQALYCQLEKEPTEAQIFQHFTPKQVNFLRKNVEILEDLVKNQIKNVKEKRKRDKVRYETKQQVSSFSASGTSAERQRTVVAEERRGEEIREEKNKEEDIPYAFRGKVIKLNDRDFNAWSKSYSSLDMMAILQSRDDYLSTRPEEERKKWFVTTSSYLASQHEKTKPKLHVVGNKKKTQAEFTKEELEEYKQELFRKCAMV